MKTKIILILLIIIIPIYCFAGTVQEKCIGVIGKKNACNTAIHEVGDRTSYASAYIIVENEMDCILYTAECTGTLEYAFIYHYGTETDNCKVGVCNYDGDAPDEGDDGCVWSTGDTVGDAAEEDNAWVQLSGKLGKAVTKGTKYFVCVLGGSGHCPVFYKSSGGTRTLYYEEGFNYASPPANLTSSTPPWATVTSRDMSVYVRIE